MFCIFTHIIYGYTGTELPPNILRTIEYVERPYSQETEAQFRSRMSGLGMAGRTLLKQKPVKPYSYPDGLDWRIILEPDDSRLNLQKLLEEN